MVLRLSRLLQILNRFENVITTGHALLAAGADTSLRNSENKTASQLALELAQQLPQDFLHEPEIENLRRLHVLFA